MLSVIAERPTSGACPASRRHDIEAGVQADGGDTESGRGLVRATVLGLACWVVLGAIVWAML
jgi:hypothetical protein